MPKDIVPGAADADRLKAQSKDVDAERLRAQQAGVKAPQQGFGTSSAVPQFGTSSAIPQQKGGIGGMSGVAGEKACPPGSACDTTGGKPCPPGTACNPTGGKASSFGTSGGVGTGLDASRQGLNPVNPPASQPKRQ